MVMLMLHSLDVKRLPLDDATSVEQSADCQQQNLPPADEENEKHDLIEVEVKIDEQGDVDPVAAGASQESVDSEEADCELGQGEKGEITDQIGSDLSAEPEETPDLQSLPNNCVRAQNQCNLESTGMENSASISIGESDESKIISTSGVEENSEPLTADMQFDTTHKSAIESKPERVDGDGESEVTDETVGSQEASLEEAVMQDQITERTGSFGVVNNDFSLEDCSTEETLTVEGTTNLSKLPSADDTAMDADQNDLGGSQAKVNVSENKVVPAFDGSSEDARGCVITEDKYSSLDSAELSVPLGSNNLNEGVVVDDSSVANNSWSGSADDTKLGTKTLNSEIGTAITPNNISDGALMPKISFGSFDFNSLFPQNDINLRSDVLNKSTAVSTSSSESKFYSSNGMALLNSQANGDPFAGMNHSSACAQVARPEQINEGSASSAKGSEADFSESQNINPDFVRRPFYWLIKILRADEGKYLEQLRESEIELAEKTKTRNAIQAEFNKHQAYCRELRNNLKTAKLEAKAAQELMRAKKWEVDSARSLINLARHAVTAEDIDDQRLNLERTLQHQTDNLREEKQLVREIRQLNLQRQQLSANSQRQQEVQQALNQRDQTEEQLKALKKELDAVRDNLSKADEQVRAAQKKHDDESALLNDLKHQLMSANDICQEAYAHSITLKKKLNAKNALFYKAKNDLRVAYNYAAAGKKDILESHCVNQVEKIMEMWNNNDEFRKEYIQCNMRRMLWKFGTLDGTQLGINDMPPSLGDVSDNRVHTSAKVNPAMAVLTVQRDLPVEAKLTEDKLSKTVKQKKAAPPTAEKNEAISKNSLANASRSIEIEEAKEEPKLTEQEEELAEKAEQSRREEEAARLREQRKLEEKAKAEEALERKRRNALKAQARAEFKARKEAEEREKARKLRAKKKQKKRGLDIDITENEPAQPSEPLSKSVKETEVTEKPATMAKRHQKASFHTKSIKTTKTIPPALRNKGKRGLLRYWSYACIVLLAIALFYLGSFERIQTIKYHISGFLHW